MEGAVSKSRARKHVVGRRAVNPETARGVVKIRPTPAIAEWDAWEERTVTHERNEICEWDKQAASEGGPNTRAQRR